MPRTLTPIQTRKSVWSDEEVRTEALLAIIKRISEGESLIRVCRDPNEKFPSPATFLWFVSQDPMLEKQYARAIEIRSDVNVEIMIDVAETENNPAKARNINDARKYHNEKLAPKKYGVRVLQETYATVDIKQKIDFTAIPSQVRDQLRQAIMKQIDLKPNVE